jgi:hypothetical protein
MSRHYFGRLTTVLLPALLLAACAQEKSSNPTSPSVAGPIAGVSISAPKLLQPASGAQVSFEQQPITLMVGNSTSTGVRPLSYVFEIASDSAFASKIFTQTGVTAGSGGQTSFRLPQPLSADRTYFWRARAEDGANTGDYAAPTSFKVFTPVVINPPTPTAPADGSTLSTLQPKFTVNNSTRTGPVTQVSYVLEIATDVAFANKVLAVEYGETTGTTSMTPSAPLAANTRFYWHVKATDPGHESPWSPTLTFVTPAPAPAPAPAPVPPPSGGQLGPGDQLDLHQVTIVLGAAGIADWPVTSTVTSTTTQDHNFCINHTMLGSWPTTPFFGDPSTPLEGNQWVFANIGGKWYGGAADWYRPGQACKDVTRQNIGSDGFYNWEPLRSWSPAPGETFGVMDSTPARLYPDMRTIDQRTNVVLVKWQ